MTSPAFMKIMSSCKMVSFLKSVHLFYISNKLILSMYRPVEQESKRYKLWTKDMNVGTKAVKVNPKQLSEHKMEILLSSL